MSNQPVLRKIHVKRMKFLGFRRGITCKTSHIGEDTCKKIEISGV